MENSMQTVRDTLHTFLEESPDSGRRIILFGAGDTYLLYKKCIELEGIDFAFFLDNGKAGSELDGKRIISPSDYAQGDEAGEDDLILIVSNGLPARWEIKAQLDSLGLKSMFFDAYVFLRHKQEILDVYDMLSDDLSKRTYADMLLLRAGIRRAIPEELVCGRIYFSHPAFTPLSKSDVFVDLGAYVGDSMESYIWNVDGVFRKIYAFEPEEQNVQAMRCRAQRLKKEWALADGKIEIVHAGIGKSESVMYVGSVAPEGPSLGAKLYGEGGQQVPVHSVDSFFHERVTFIKADIEGFEYDMLLGAEQTIKACRPRMAISIYHGASDLYSIPLLIKAFCGDYKFAVRHHTYRLDDTVLYAYI